MTCVSGAGGLCYRVVYARPPGNHCTWGLFAGQIQTNQCDIGTRLGWIRLASDVHPAGWG